MDYLNAFKLIIVPGKKYQHWNEHYRTSIIREDGLETMAYLSDYGFKSAVSLIVFCGLLTQKVPCKFERRLNGQLIQKELKYFPKHPFITLFAFSSFVYCFSRCYHYAYRFQTLYKQEHPLKKYNQ